MTERAPVPPEAVDAVARYLHDEVAECVGGTTKECGRWKSPAHVRHVDYYREMAAAVLQVAVPAIRADERERIRQLAIQHGAVVPDTTEDDYGTEIVRARPFADLLGGEPQ